MDPNSFITRVISMLSRVAVSRLIAIVPPQLPKSCLRHTTITNNLHDATKRVDHTANEPASTGQSRSVGEYEGFQNATSDRIVTDHAICGTAHRSGSGGTKPGNSCGGVGGWGFFFASWSPA